MKDGLIFFKPGTPAKERIKGRSKEVGACWEWQGDVGADGYGRLTYEGKAWRAHRLSYTCFKGEIKGSLLVMHSCDNPKCVNPTHLSLGTVADNAIDSVRKNRHFGTKKTCCINGHEYTAENTRTTAFGKRKCRLCERRTHCPSGHEYTASNTRIIANGKSQCIACNHKTHCPSGHEYTAENTRVLPGGKRRCIICNKAFCKASYRKN